MSIPWLDPWILFASVLSIDLFNTAESDGFRRTLSFIVLTWGWAELGHLWTMHGFPLKVAICVTGGSFTPFSSSIFSSGFVCCWRKWTFIGVKNIFFHKVAGLRFIYNKGSIKIKNLDETLFKPTKILRSDDLYKM